jgi:competence protein ComFC
VFNLIKEIGSGLLDLLFPAVCLGCGKAEPLELCSDCQNKILPLKGKLCKICSNPIDFGKLCASCQNHPPAFIEAHVLSSYEGILRKAIITWKYEKHEVLTQPLGQMLANFVSALECLPELKIVTFVPLHPQKEKNRGFNQARELALILGKKFELRTEELLERIRATRTQTQLTFTERKLNMQGAFRLKAGVQLKNKNILLVDDVMTTGATLQECAKVLKLGGAARVYTLVLAREIRK